MSRDNPKPAGVVSVAATCPAIDEVKRMVAWHMDIGERRTKTLLLLESLRQQNTQLRANAALWERACRVARKQHAAAILAAMTGGAR